MVKDAILQYGSVDKFPMPQRLLDLCSTARKKYFLSLDIEKENREKLLKEQEKAKANLASREQKKANSEKKSQLEEAVKEETVKLNVAMKLIAERNEFLSQLTIGKKRSVDKEDILKAQMMLNAGIEKSAIINKKIDSLRNNIKNLSS